MVSLKEKLMNTFSASKTLFIVITLLVVTQFACNFGAQTAGGGAGESATAAPAGTKSERGTPDEAKAMLQLAIQHYQSAGRDQALADFTAGISPFKDRDLYVACIGSNHVTTANGGFPNLVGVSVDSVLTTDGKPLGKASWDAASTSTINSVSYHWTNPVTGQTEPKTLFFEKVGTDVCGVGAYNP
jgi:cytochrome c